MNKKNKVQCVFLSSHKDQFQFIEAASEAGKVLCRICNSKFSITHGGKNDIVSHIKTNKHQNAVSLANSSKQIQEAMKQFVTPSSKKSELDLAAKEATFAYHTARHDISFRSTDCTSKLISKLFDAKYTSARTKSTAIATNIIAPLLQKEVEAVLNSSNFITIITDTSNRNATKLLPIVSRTFSPVFGVQHQKLNLFSLSDETSDTISKAIIKTAKQYNIQNKAVGFTGNYFIFLKFYYQ